MRPGRRARRPGPRFQGSADRRKTDRRVWWRGCRLAH